MKSFCIDLVYVRNEEIKLSNWNTENNGNNVMERFNNMIKCMEH